MVKKKQLHPARKLKLPILVLNNHFIFRYGDFVKLLLRLLSEILSGNTCFSQILFFKTLLQKRQTANKCSYMVSKKYYLCSGNF
jgi:hypothetical protein